MGPSTGPLPASSAQEGNSFNEVPCTCLLDSILPRSKGVIQIMNLARVLTYAHYAWSAVPVLLGVRGANLHYRRGQLHGHVGGKAKSNRQLLSSIRACSYQISTVYKFSNAFA